MKDSRILLLGDPETASQHKALIQKEAQLVDKGDHFSIDKMYTICIFVQAESYKQYRFPPQRKQIDTVWEMHPRSVMQGTEVANWK